MKSVVRLFPAHLLPPMSLRIKLVLSYLLVALGTILILTLAVSLAVRNYLVNAQIAVLHQEAAYQAEQLEHTYRFFGNWDSVLHGNIEIGGPALLVLMDTAGRQILCAQPASLAQQNCDDPTLRQALTTALSGQTTDGNIQISIGGATVSSLYVSMPLGVDGQTIGAMFLSEPQLYPNSFSSFLEQVNQAIIIAGLIVALLATLFSFLLARRLTQPLESLTVAAEKMKHGRYAERVTPPKSQDELGRLALTFNAMADTIEADMTELRRQEQARRDLIANIAHDLATPLTAIQGLSEALADDLITDSNARQETAQRIGREVQRLRRLVADMQHMSALESGQASLDLAPLDLHALVNETLTVLAPEFELASLSVSNEIAPTTPLVLADSDRITQVLLNLLDNARRHTPAGGSIHITATPGEKLLTLSIRDTGVGIDAADLPHIFERFYRADRSRTGATGGSGLGLSIVKAIITAHGGTIRAESTPGKGTSIVFTLPLWVNKDISF
jgi:signal transduction histidine kinase